MNPTYPHQPPAPSAPPVIEIRYKPYLGIMILIAGAVGVVAGALSLTGTGEFLYRIWIVIGPLFLVMGVMTFLKPFAAYDIGQGNLHMYNMLGFRVRTWGAAKGERIVFDGANIMSLRADGSQKKVGLSSVGRPEDVQRLQQTLWSLQQQPPTGRF